jgi:hypothetical protein
MAGNFRGMLIFVVDLQSRKFPPPKLNDYRYVSIEEGRGQKHRGSAATRSSVLASNNRYCHPADGVFDANIVPSHAICLNLFAVVAQ